MLVVIENIDVKYQINTKEGTEVHNENFLESLTLRNESCDTFGVKLARSMSLDEETVEGDETSLVPLL